MSFRLIEVDRCICGSFETSATEYEMPLATRSLNLDLIRWLNRGHKHAVTVMASVTNAKYLSEMATGEREISDPIARGIETAADLPAGWLDRDNVSLLKMPSIQLEIHLLVCALSEEKQKALLTLLDPRS